MSHLKSFYHSGHFVLRIHIVHGGHKDFNSIVLIRRFILSKISNCIIHIVDKITCIFTIQLFTSKHIIYFMFEWRKCFNFFITSKFFKYLYDIYYLVPNEGIYYYVPFDGYFTLSHLTSLLLSRQMKAGHLAVIAKFLLSTRGTW